MACAYIASIPFFVILYQIFKLLGYRGQREVSSQRWVLTLRTIKYCALVIICFVATGEAYLFLARPDDDIAGGVFMGLLIFFVSAIIAITAVILERTHRSKRSNACDF